MVAIPPSKVIKIQEDVEKIVDESEKIKEEPKKSKNLNSSFINQNKTEKI